MRIGIRRPDRPTVAVADAEARVLRAELARRLGDVTLDLRVDGAPLGEWQPTDHAGWPATVDAEIDAERLWGEGLPRLTALFATTVDPAAADVRRRMLEHLGVTTPGDLLCSPTDAWLLGQFATDAAEIDRLGAALDAIADELRAAPVAPPTVQLSAERDALRAENARLRDELARAAAEAADRLDGLAGELAVLRERLARAES